MALLLKMSISGSVLILGIIIVRSLLLHKLPKKTFIILWSIAFCRLIIPFYIPSSFNIYSIFTKLNPMEPIVNLSLGESVLNFIVSPPATGTTMVTDQTFSTIFFYVWLIGFLVCLISYAVLYIRGVNQFNKSVPIDNAYISEWIANNKFKYTYEIRVTDRTNTPLVYDISRSIILMPETFDLTDTTALDYILTHELQHVKNNDLMKKLCLNILVCIHWFNPLVWVMYFLSNRDIELNCDENVIRKVGSDSQMPYAFSLIGIKKDNTCIPSAYSAFSNSGERSLKERLECVMEPPKKSKLSIILLVLLSISSTVFFTTIGEFRLPSWIISQQRNKTSIQNIQNIQNANTSNEHTTYTEIYVYKDDPNAVHLFNMFAFANNLSCICLLVESQNPYSIKDMTFDHLSYWLSEKEFKERYPSYSFDDLKYIVEYVINKEIGFIV